MSHDALWEQLQNDWQTTTPAVDVHALAAKAKRKQYRMIVFQALDLVSACAATIVFPRISFGPGWIGTFPLALFLPLMWLGVIAGAWTRRGTWRSKDTDPRTLLQLACKRARAGLLYIWLNLGIAVLLYVALIPWIWRGQKLATPLAQSEVKGVLIVFAATFAGLLGWAIWYAIRQKRKWRHAKALLDQLD
ncbi:MAG TPA: hypothetical protein VF269_03485 [Rhodanobacteraceae bacterium]